MTEDDTTDRILEATADDYWEHYEELWYPLETISARECMLAQAMCIPTTQEPELDRYLKSVRLLPGFENFVRACERLGVDLIINSDGFDHAIHSVLNRYGLGKLRSQVRSNHLTKINLTYCLAFPHGSLRCEAQQGTCKCQLAQRAVDDGRGIVVIGNDRTDVCVAKNTADCVFVKIDPKQSESANALVRACRDHTLPIKCDPFKTFDQIAHELPSLIKKYGRATRQKRIPLWHSSAAGKGSTQSASTSKAGVGDVG